MQDRVNLIRSLFRGHLTVDNAVTNRNRHEFSLSNDPMTLGTVESVCFTLFGEKNDVNFIVFIVDKLGKREFIGEVTSEQVIVDGNVISSWLDFHALV